MESWLLLCTMMLIFLRLLLAVDGQYSDPVTGLTLTQFNDVRLRASWNAPINNASYKELVDYRVFINNEDINSNDTIVLARTTTYTLPGTYTPGTTVTLHVRATSRHLWSITITQQFAIVGVLRPKIIFSASNDSSVTLNMSQPNTTPGVSTNQYIATLTSSACPDVPTRMGTTNDNSITVSNLEAGIQYTASVIASNTNYGYNSSAETVMITTQETTPNGFPGTPTRNASTSTSINLTWTEIDCIQRNGAITYYIIQYGEGTNGNVTINTSTSSLTYMISSLKPYTEYNFTVAGANSVGVGPASNVGVIRTDEDVPSEVVNITATSNLTSVLLKWNKPTIPNGVIIAYTITYSIGGSSIINKTSNTTSLKISRLLPQTTVSDIRVTARTRIGPGPAVTYPNVTTSILPKIDNIAVIILNNTSISISWEHPQLSYITHYVVNYSIEVNMIKQTLSITVNAPATSVEITGLINSVQIHFQIIAFPAIIGTEFRVESSVLNIPLINTKNEFSAKEKRTVIIISTAIFLGTIALYSIILMLVIGLLYFNKHLRNRKKSQHMNMEVCEAYGHVQQVNAQETVKPHYESIF